MPLSKDQDTTCVISSFPGASSAVEAASEGPHVLRWHPVGGVGPNQADYLTQKPSPHPSRFPALALLPLQRSGALLSPGRSLVLSFESWN